MQEKSGWQAINDVKTEGLNSRTRIHLERRYSVSLYSYIFLLHLHPVKVRTITGSQFLVLDFTISPFPRHMVLTGGYPAFSKTHDCYLKSVDLILINQLKIELLLNL